MGTERRGLITSYLRRLDRGDGDISQDSIDLASYLIQESANWLTGKIKYLGGGLFGNDLGTSLIPLINETGVSAADKGTPVNLDNSHYSERGVSGGIQKNPNSDGYFDTSVRGSTGTGYAYYYDEAFNFYRIVEPTVDPSDNYFGLADNTGSGTPGNFFAMRLMAFVVGDGLTAGDENTFTHIFSEVLR